MHPPLFAHDKNLGQDQNGRHGELHHFENMTTVVFGTAIFTSLLCAGPRSLSGLSVQTLDGSNSLRQLYHTCDVVDDSKRFIPSFPFSNNDEVARSANWSI